MFVPIRVSTINPGIEFDFDVYIKIKEKYILYTRKGDDIDLNRLDNFRKKELKQVFILDTDEKKYQEYLEKGLAAAANDPNMSSQDRADTAGGVAASAVEDMHNNYEDLGSFALLEKASKGIVDIVGKRKDVLKELYSKNARLAEVDVTFRHAINVASLASCLAQVCELSDQDEQNLAVASMLSDISMAKMSAEEKFLFTSDQKLFSKEDWVKYKTHPKMSAEMLADKSYINKEILDLVLTHEERKSGEGFPQGISNLDIKQEIIGICSCYDHMVTCMALSHKDAVSEIQINQLGNFDLELIKKFKKVLKDQGLNSK